MRTRIFFLLIVVISGCTVFKKEPTQENPPGTVKINDTLFVDQTEVANVHWREYLYYLNRFDSGNAYKALPDTLVWRDSNPFNEPLTKYYFRHPMFNRYPAVGISYEQAVEFCKWRTYVANQGVYFRQNKIKDLKNHIQDSFPIKFYYRLASNKEWEMIAAGQLSATEFPYGHKDVYAKWRGKKWKAFNCIYPEDSTKKTAPDGPYTVDVKAFLPNAYGTYNMIGNLSEMLSEKGTAKGGSFVHPLDSCKIVLNQHYEKPEVWLGFRCVAVKLR
jgi:formylglycine-generating enzyme required for sulfatase activity